MLVVIDQFEELFTSTGADERDHFLRALTCAVTEPEGSLRVVATMRADFCDDALGHPAFAAPFKAGLVPIAPLSPDELETAITAPAAAVGVTFEPGLVAEIVAEVSGRPGALPLLQYSLRQAFDATDGETVTVDCYREVGGLTGALSRSAELAFSESSEDERIAMRRLFGRLVALGDGNDDTRRRVRRHELPADAALDAVIERLGVMRLLTFDHDPATRAPTVEVAHEAVLRVWMRLRRWLDEDRARLRTHRHLSEAATAWNDRERDPTELYRGGRLDAAEELVEVDSAALNEIETDFLRASLRQRDEQRDREQRRVRRLRRIVVATTATTVVAMLATVVAVLQWTRAEHESERAVANEQEAIERTAEATAQRLAVQSVQAQALDPDLAINLALESIRRTDEAGLPPVDGAVSALHDATQSSRLVARFETTGPAAMDEGGDAIALMRPGGELVVVDAVTQEVEQRAPIAGDVEEIRFVPGGSRILVLTRQETVLLDRGDMSPVAVVQVPCCRSSGEIEFDATGQQVAIGIEGDTSGTTLVLDSTDLDEVAQLDAVSPAGWLGGELIVFDSENVEAVDPLTDARRHLLDVDAPGSVDMDAQGTRLAITGSGRVSLWQFRGQSVAHVNDLDIDFGSGLGRGAHFTADGRHVLVIKDPIEVVPVEAVPDDPGGRLLLPGHGAIWDWATTELGDRLLASSVGEALLWDLAPAGPADLGAIDVIGNVWEIEWSDDGSVMYVADSTGDEARVRAIDISSLSTIATVDGFAPTEGAGPVVGRTGLVAGHRGDDERGVVVDVRTGEAVAALEPCFEPYSIDDAGRWMIVVCEDDAEGGSYVVDPATGEELSDLGPAGGFSAIGPPGTRSDGLAVYQTPDGLALRDLRTGAEFGPFAGQLFPWRPFFSADGRFVTAGSAHGGGIVLDVAEIVEGATGDDPLVRNPRPGAGGTTFSIVAGDYFVTGHDGEILRFWGPSDERPEFDLDVRSRDTTFLATSPDARYLYYEAEGDVLRRFPLALTDLVAAGEARARRGFTVDECERFSLAGDCGLFIESQ